MEQWFGWYQYAMQYDGGEAWKHEMWSVKDAE